MYVMPGSLDRLEPAGRSWEDGQFLVPVRNNKGRDSDYENGVREQEVNEGAISEKESNLGVLGVGSVANEEEGTWSLSIVSYGPDGNALTKKGNIQDEMPQKTQPSNMFDLVTGTYYIIHAQIAPWIQA